MKKENEIKELLIKTKKKHSEHLANYEKFGWTKQNIMAEQTRIWYQSWIDALEWVLDKKQK